MKFRRLVYLLKIPIPYVLGHLELLWHFGNESGEVIGDLTNLELAAEWQGKPGELTEALLKCGGEGRAGFIDESINHPGIYKLHDWYDHAPKYALNYDAKKIIRKRERTCIQCGTIFQSSSDSARFCSSACKQACYRNRAKPNQDDGDELDINEETPENEKTVTQMLRNVTRTQPNPTECNLPNGALPIGTELNQAEPIPTKSFGTVPNRAEPIRTELNQTQSNISTMAKDPPARVRTHRAEEAGVCESGDYRAVGETCCRSQEGNSHEAEAPRRKTEPKEKELVQSMQPDPLGPSPVSERVQTPVAGGRAFPMGIGDIYLEKFRDVDHDDFACFDACVAAYNQTAKDIQNQPVEKKHAHFARIENSADAFLALLKGCEWTAGEAMDPAVIQECLRLYLNGVVDGGKPYLTGLDLFWGDPAGTKSASWRDFYPEAVRIVEEEGRMRDGKE